MKVYLVDKMKNKETYNSFIRYMLLNSDFFSVVYYRQGTNMLFYKDFKEYKKGLEPFLLYAENVSEWPHTKTMGGEAVYRLMVYCADMKCYDILTRVNDIFEWSYPRAPVDLCFYRKGYCWFALTAHEKEAYLYTNNDKEVQELQKLGVDIEYWGEKGDLFYLDLYGFRQ